jgi:hypothetical protein
MYFPICLCVCWWDSFISTFIHSFPNPSPPLYQPLPPSVLSTYQCQFALPPFSRFFIDVSCTVSWSFTIFRHSFRNYLQLLLGSQSLDYHYFDSLQFQISVPFHATFFPLACDVLLRHSIQFGSIITLVWFHLFYLHADVFFNDIGFTSVSVCRPPFHIRSRLSCQVTFTYPQRIFSLTCSSHLGVVLELLT